MSRCWIGRLDVEFCMDRSFGRFWMVFGGCFFAVECYCKVLVLSHANLFNTNNSFFWPCHSLVNLYCNYSGKFSFRGFWNVCFFANHCVLDDALHPPLQCTKQDFVKSYLAYKKELFNWKSAPVSVLKSETAFWSSFKKEMLFHLSILKVLNLGVATPPGTTYSKRIMFVEQHLLLILFVGNL